jgi:uncharacterized protein YdeI (YjbR/CyaY-like superfamily)
VEVESRAAWRQWLAAHHEDAPGVWLVTFKKAAGERHLPYDQVARRRCASAGSTPSPGAWTTGALLLVTPRKPGSGWSRPNKRRIERLEAAGLLAPAGRAVVEAARADGSWTALDDIENLIEPDDLRAALDASPAARRERDAFPRTSGVAS